MDGRREGGREAGPDQPTHPLQELREHVICSDVLIALQTSSYLLRPFCIVELLTAIEFAKPILGLKIEGQRESYNFEVPGTFQ